MPKIINLEQGSLEWHIYRKNKIGASDAPIIFGVNPWKTPYQLWQEKLDLVEQQPMNEAMKRGHELEPIARNKCTELLGIALKPLVLEDITHEWLFASYDAISENGQIIVEIKCPMRGLHENVPNHYLPQLHQQMAVANVKKCFYYSFNGQEGNLIEVNFEEKYWEDILLKEKEFYKCMVNFEQPKLEEKDYINMENNTEWEKTACELQMIKSNQHYLEDLEKKTKEKLIKLSLNTNARLGNIKLSKVIRRGNIEYSKIDELKKIDLEKYRKPKTENWKFTF